MRNDLVCWKCGASIADVPLPLGRLAQCPACHIDLHVCRMCQYYDPRVSEACRHPIAEEVKDKERSNFCDYFRPKPGAYRPRDDTEARAARAQLDALFGLGSGKAVEDASSKAGLRSEADAASKELERLFGLDS
jgi:hypothetical protein